MVNCVVCGKEKVHCIAMMRNVRKPDDIMQPYRSGDLEIEPWCKECFEALGQA